MRKVLFIATAVLFGLNVQAQSVDFGITAGYLNGRASVKFDEGTFSDSQSGFFIGALVDFVLTEKTSIQPELLYANIDEGSALMLPVMLKSYITEKLNFQVGPQFVFSLEESVEDFSNVELGLAGGLGFDITSNFFLQARYSFQLSNSYTGNEDVKVRANYFTAGVGYKF